MIDPSTLFTVVPQHAAESIAAELRDVGSRAEEAVSQADNRWSQLEEYFRVYGAEGVFQMLEQPKKDADSFRDSLHDAARKADTYAAEASFLETSRAAFLDEITQMNQRLGGLQTALSNARWNRWVQNYESGSTQAVQVNNAVSDAEWSLANAQEDEAYLRQRIGMFNDMVETSELDFASALNRITHGTQVMRVDGKPMSSTLDQWGASGASMQDVPMMQRFQFALTDRVEHRLDWMLSNPAGYCAADGTTVGTPEAWLASHSSFIAALGLVDPQRMANWFAAKSGYQGSSWKPSGEFQTMLDTMPGVIGNLNGVPAEVRNTYNQAYLAELLTNPNISYDDLTRLHAVQESLMGRDGSANSDRYLMSLFTDNNEVRAAVAQGNPDHADMTVTLTHGISTDTLDLPDWVAGGTDLQWQLGEELARRGYTASEGNIPVSTIAWFGYESKGAGEVQGTTHAEVGAQRYSMFQEGLAVQNSDGIRNGWFHSYGTTVAGQMISRTPEVLDQAYMIGSAGWTPDAGTHIGAQQEIPVYASSADKDWTAWMGRTPLISEHSIDPRSVDGVIELSAETGTVDFGIDTDGQVRVETGEEVQGHGSHEHNPAHELWRTQRGYLDPDSRTYLEGIDMLADQLEYTE